MLFRSLFAAAVPGLRHRHTGGVTHSHGDGLVHTHGDGMPAHSHRDGWHVHITLFGFSLTLWEPGSNAAEAASTLDTQSVARTEARDGHPVLLATSPVTAGWSSLFWIEAAPVPAILATTTDDSFSPCSPPSDEAAASRFDAPPVPPPEAV